MNQIKPFAKIFLMPKILTRRALLFFFLVVFVVYSSIDTKLHFDVTSSVSASTQFFYAVEDEEFTEDRSIKSLIKKDENSLMIAMPSSTSTVRWDPINGAGIFIINKLIVSFLFFKINIIDTIIVENHEIMSINSINGGISIETIDNAEDPSVIIKLPMKIIFSLKLLISFILALIVTSVLILIWKKKGNIKKSLTINYSTVSNRALRRLYWPSAKQIFRLSRPEGKAQRFISLNIFSAKKNKALLLIVVGVGLLAGQNAYLLKEHYFYGYGIPYDFLQTYLAVPYYWIEAINSGSSASWVPFQGMGYPLYANLQSGFYYLPNWIFILFSESYTVTAAVFFQGFHMLIGSLGALFAARLFKLSWLEAILVGVLYQCFGAFYTNGQHVDIIRALAFLPWIIGPVLCPLKDKSTLLTVGILMLPMWLLFLWTGGYIGSSIAITFVIGVTVVVRVIAEPDNRKLLLFILSFMTIGGLLICIKYFPVLLSINEYARSSAGTNLYFDYFQWIDIFSLIFGVNNPALPHDISMRSTFVGIITIFLLISGIKNIFTWNKWLMFSLILSLLMGAKILHPILVQYIPQLGLSRFTMSDYRGIVGFSLILLAVGNIKNIVKGDQLNLYIFSGLVFLFVFIGSLSLGLDGLNYLKELVRVLLVGIFVSFALYYISKKRTKLLIPLLIIIALVDWHRVFRVKPYFLMPEVTSFVESSVGMYDETQQMLHSKFADPPERRGKRIESGTAFRGYYTGEYMMNDYAGPQGFKRHIKIYTTPKAYAFGMSAWKAIRLDDKTNHHLPEVIEQLQVNGVKTSSYGSTRIKYDVTLLSPTDIVENEVYWKGWSMDIMFSDGVEMRLKPFEVDGFRAWSLPQGSYTMQANYETPGRNVGIYISVFGLVLWLIFGYLLIFVKKSKNIIQG